MKNQQTETRERRTSMAATIGLFEAERRKPGFINERPAGVPWVLKIKRCDGTTEELSDAEWEAVSKFGGVRNVVVCDTEGRPLFERPEYREAPNVNVIAYGVRNGEAHIAMLHEVRPHADDPTDPDSGRPVTFGQIPMGFLEKLLGKDVPAEGAELAAVREVAEETGGTAVTQVTRPKYAWQNPNPTFVPTWSQLVYVQVDLDRLEKIRPQRGELIYKAEYIPAKELLRRISEGQHKGAIYRASTSLSLLMIFFADHPEFFRV